MTALGIGIGFITGVVLGPEAVGAELALAGVADAAIQRYQKGPWARAGDLAGGYRKLADHAGACLARTNLVPGGFIRREPKYRPFTGTRSCPKQCGQLFSIGWRLRFLGPHLVARSRAHRWGLDQVHPLRLAFTTYLVSNALAQNGWHVLLLPGETRSCSISRPILAAIQPAFLILVLTPSTARRRQPECNCQWLTNVPIVGVWLLFPEHRSPDMQPRLRPLWALQRQLLVVQQRSKQRLHLKPQR